MKIAPSLVTDGSEHEWLYKAGIIHCDISTNNILISGGKGSLIDFNHSKIMICTQTLSLLTSEYLRPKSAWTDYFPKVDERVFEFAKWRLGCIAVAYLYSVAEMWKLDLEDGDVKTMTDFGWDGKVSN